MILPRIVRVSCLSNENAVLNSPPRGLSADYETEVFHFKSRKHKLTSENLWPCLGACVLFFVCACLLVLCPRACLLRACLLRACAWFRRVVFFVLFLFFFLFSFCSFFCSFFVFFVFFFIIFNFFTMCARVERLLI